jgi:penicillin G amidase
MRPWRRVASWAGACAGLAFIAAVATAWGLLALSRPQLEGVVRSGALSGEVTVERDGDGVPAVTGTDRADIAYATGYLHAQERFFQMDLMRRLPSGELAALVGEQALPVDRAMRLHRLRALSRRAADALDPERRRVFDAYVSGVNDGLAALTMRPFEYLLLRTKPQPWTLEDTFLAVYAMYLDLQDENGTLDRRRGLLADVLGPQWAAFLYPGPSPLDAPIDGSAPTGGLPDIPAMLPPVLAAPGGAGGPQEEPPQPGSNSFAVAGSLSATGSAIVANDMHLTLRVPNIWYRARLKLEGAHPLDVTGVMLPGTPVVVVGSNRSVAWAFTNSNIDTTDLVAIEWIDQAAGLYRTPAGPERMTTVEERICAHDGACETLAVPETVWGPILPRSDRQGRTLAVHWAGHQDGAVNAELIDMERAANVEDAMAVAHRAGIPTQNFIVGDSAGRIAWTLAGPVPDRFGFDGTTPQSWADGTKGWRGFLKDADVPVLRDPASHRLWSANGRMVTGAALARLGEGGYDVGARQSRIRDLLAARDRFAERDLLQIQLDDRPPLLDRWFGLLATEARRDGRTRLLASLEDWTGRAEPDVVSYRVVKAFRSAVTNRVLRAFTGPLERDLGPRDFPWVHSLSEIPVWTLASSSGSAPMPPGYRDWEALFRAALDDVEKGVADAGGYGRFRWGQENVTAIHHSLATGVPGLSWLTDPPQVALPGDRAHLPRINSGDQGASERMVVSPGHEESGIYEMPSGQSGHPLSPYFNGGHENWVRGAASPFLPGPARWTLRFERKG